MKTEPSKWDDDFNEACKALSDGIINFADAITLAFDGVNFDDEIIHEALKVNLDQISYFLTLPPPNTEGQTSKRDHGWYHKFNKPNGKRNLKR